MKIILTAIATVFATTSASLAKPMWEVSDKWQCALEMYIKAPIGAKPSLMDHSGKSYVLDFAAGTSTSAFTETVGKIVDTHYYEGDFGNHNVVVVGWDGSGYPTIIVEDKGEYWETAASGWADEGRETWIVTYRCIAVGGLTTDTSTKKK